MAVVAKFNVTSIEDFASSSKKVNMAPVYNPPEGQEGHDPTVTGKEDGSFWEATPGGSLELYINNPLAAEQFQPGDKFYLTFERADAGD